MAEFLRWMLESSEVNVGLAGVAALNSTGMLDVSITRLTGDFGLWEVTLLADVTRAVPEPGTLGLLLLGILGLGVARRTQKRS